MKFEYTDASGLSQRSANRLGTVFSFSLEGAEGDAVERDPMIGNVGPASPYFTFNTNEPDDETLDLLGSYSQNSMNPQAVTYNIDGISVPSWIAQAALQNGSAFQCPNNFCGSRVFINSQGQRTLSSPFYAYAHGTSSYRIPIWGETGSTVLDDNGNVDTGIEGGGYEGEIGIIGWENYYVASEPNSWIPREQAPPRPKEDTATDEDCNEHIRNLRLPEVKKALLKAWEDSDYRESILDRERYSHEEGGLLGLVSAGKRKKFKYYPFKRQNNKRGELTGFKKWAKRFMNNNKGVSFIYFIHSHPYEHGDRAEERDADGRPQYVNYPKYPSGYGQNAGDFGVSGELGLYGIIISSKHLTVFWRKGQTDTRCFFDRKDFY